MHDVDSAQKSNGRIPGAKVKTIGIIGLGSIGLRHAKNLRGLGYHIWGYDPDTKKRLELGYEYTTKNPEHMKEADAFIIASPTEFHYDHIYQFLQHSMNVFVEKPIAHSLEEPLDRTLLRQVMMVGYNLRFHGCVKKAMEWIWMKFLGDIEWANFTLGQFSEKPPYLRDGVILNWSHEIDLALYLLGNATIESSRVRLTNNKDDLADIFLKHESGCLSTVHLDYLTEPEVRQFIIVGNQATIIADLVNRHAWLRDRDGSILEHFEDTETWNDNYIEEMRAFIDRIDGKETIGCTAEEALKVLDICLEVRKQAGLT